MSGATPLGNMVVKIGLDDADFGRGVENSKKQIRYLTKEMQANMKIADLAGNGLGKMQTRFSSLTGIIQAQEKQVKALKTAYEGSFVDGKATDSTKRLAAQLQEANGKLANYKQQLIQSAGAIAEYQVKNEGLTGSIYKNSQKMITAGDQMSKVGGKLTTGLTLPIAGAAVAVGKAAISWESAFAGVKKTNDEVTDSTGKVVYSYKDLEDGLRSLAKELPSSHAEIANVAEAAGQLGIQTPNVKSFTKTMIDLGESTNMSAETAATELARFANITGMSQKNFSNLGSALVDLGNNFATTESEISSMSLRLAGAGKQIGMSEGDILGFAAALSSVGVEAEAGGSAFSKVMVQMQLAVEKGGGAFDDLKESASNAGLTWEQVSSAVRNGGKELKSVAGQMGMTSAELKKMVKEADKSAGSLDNFANVAGMTSEQFSKMFKDDPAGAIMKFVEGLATAEERGTSAIAVLDEMGITEVRLRDSLLRAAGASGVFSKAVETGNKAFKKNTALTEEAGKRYETTESKLKMLKNEVVDTAIDMGGPLVDALRDGVQAGKPLIEMLGKAGKAFSDADPKTQQMIVKLLAYTAAAGPVLKLTGSITKSVGGMGKTFVEMSAQMAKKKAMAEITKQMAEGAVSADTLSAAFAGGTGKIAGFGSAAASASGASGIGAMTAALGPLGPAILGIVGVGGALAVGYGAWKLFGEEAWNSSQRVKRWGTEVGESTDQTLTKLQGAAQSAGGEFSLLEQGISGNTESIVANFSRMGTTIEKEMTGKIAALKEMVKTLPEDVQGAADELTQEEIKKQEEHLQIVQDNNKKITQIRQDAANNNRQISIQEATQIKALATESATAYVQSLGKSKSETQQILSAMTGDVESATRDQSKTWLQSLGKQRQQSKSEYAKMTEDLKTDLVDAGYDLNSDYAKEMLGLLEESSKSATQLTEDQMALILGKYPELAEEVFLANGQLISSMGDAGSSAVDQNKKMMESFEHMSSTAAKTAEENAKKLDLVADEANQFGEFWNGLILDPKTGDVKTNAQEEVNKAAQSEAGWNKLMWASKDANLSSNAKLMIAEAAIANGKWDSMSFTEQQALIESNVTQEMTQALQASGKWDGLSFEQKKAVLYSNTPEVMAETLLNLGLWNEEQIPVKDLKAKNEQFLQTLSESEEKIQHWGSVPADVKEILGDNYDLLTKVYSSEEAYGRWKAMPDTEKKFLAANEDLMAKVMTSEEAYNAWSLLPDNIKRMLADNVDLQTKIAEGNLSLDLFKANEPAIKMLMGDSASVTAAAASGEGGLNSYAANNPAHKPLTGDAASVSGATATGNSALNGYAGNNPALKNLIGNPSSVVGASNTGNSALNSYKSNNPSDKNLKANDNTSGPVSTALSAIGKFSAGPSTITKTLRVVANIGAGVAKILGFEKGTKYHVGGPAIVNDQKGPLYKELVVPKGGVPFIPEGRDVFLPDLPKGSQVYTARQTKRLVPKYKDGIGVPKDSSMIRNLMATKERVTEKISVNVDNISVVQAINDLAMLISNSKDKPLDLRLKIGDQDFSAFVEKISEVQGREIDLLSNF